MSGGGRDPLRRRHPDRQPGGRHPAGAARAPRGRSHRRRGHAPHAHAPRAPRHRAPRLAALVREPRALVFFEAARRLAAFLAAAEAALGDREAAIARELTKRHEEILRGRLSALRERVARRASLRGEVTVLVAGAPAAEPARDVASVDDELRAGRAAGRGLRELAAEIARRTGMPRREVYRRGLALERQRGSV